MAMIEINTPRYYFRYEDVKEGTIKYVKDYKGAVHKIMIKQIITAHSSRKNEKPLRYASYKIEQYVYKEGALKRAFNKLLNKKDVKEKIWVEIEPSFYDNSTFMTFHPSALVQEEKLYDTPLEAKVGQISYIFKEYNSK